MSHYGKLLKNWFNALGYTQLLLMSLGFAILLLWMVQVSLTTYAQAVLVVFLLSFLYFVLRRYSAGKHPEELGYLRIVAILIASFISFRYFYWRISYTINYHDFLSFVFGIMLLLAELFGLTVYILGAFVNIWPINRTPPKLPDDPEAWLTVDVLIPSYNEDAAMLEMTLLAATQLDYPKSRYKVYLCDDGGTVQRRNRSDISEQSWARFHQLNLLCEKVGAIYLTREKNEHAKAGNLNAALQDHCRGELVLILDADHIPTRDFLQNTVGFFNHDPKLFLVQTPHHFINPDPLERNLRTYGYMPSENEMFYSQIQPGLDFWGASFFCGSAAVLRREHLDLIGGIAGETITEDAETAMTLHGQHGLHSIYYNKPMMAGLQPETFSGFVVQRTRWAQGMMQIFILKNPWFQPKMKLVQRLAYTSSVAFWFFPFARAMFFIAPPLFLFFDFRLMDAYVPGDIFAYALPHVLAAIFLSNLLYGKVRWPFISEIYETIQTVYSLPAIIAVMYNPRSPAFAVTPKGEKLEENFVSDLVIPFYVMAFIDVLCIVVGVYELILQTKPATLVILVMVLATANMLFSLAAIGVMFEKSQKRGAQRLSMEAFEYSAHIFINGIKVAVKLDDISHTGISFFLNAQGVALSVVKGGEVSLWLNNGVEQALFSLSVRVTGIQLVSDNTYEIRGVFELATLEAKRNLVNLVYGDSSRHEGVQIRRQRRISPLVGFILLLKLAFLPAQEHFIFVKDAMLSKLVRRLKSLRI